MRSNRVLLGVVVAMSAMTSVLAYPRDAVRLTQFLAEAINFFNEKHPNNGIAMQCATCDVTGDTIPELLLANSDLSIVEVYDTDENASMLRTVAVTPDDYKDTFWVDINYLWNQFNDLDWNSDLTLKYRPLFVTADIKNNRYTVFHDVEWDDVGDPSEYDCMVFKPHVNGVRYIGQNNGVSAHVYALVDPSVKTKMFRGYQDYEAMPFIVPHDFFAYHNVLQFSRWKSPEPIERPDADVRTVIEHHFKGYQIAEAHWLASCPTAERTFYAVTFKPRRGDDFVLASVVCIAEGMVSTTLDVRGYLEDGVSNWYGDDDFFAHAPEIMAMTASDRGFEFYCRWNSMEGTHYSIYRELMDHFVLISDEYEYWQY